MLQYATVGSVARPREQSCARGCAARCRRPSTGRAAEELLGAAASGVSLAQSMDVWIWQCRFLSRWIKTEDKNNNRKQQLDRFALPALVGREGR